MMTRRNAGDENSAERRDAKPASPEADDKPWKLVVGRRPQRVTAVERDDRDFVVYVRYTEMVNGTRVPRNRPLEPEFRVRNESGRRVASRVKKAVELVEKLQASLRSGTLGAAAADGGASGAMRIAPQPVPARIPQHGAATGGAVPSLKLRKGFDEWLDSLPQGTKNTDAAEREADRLCAILGPARRWEEITCQDLKDGWKALYKEWKPEQRRKGRQPEGGPVIAKRMISRVFTCARWLRKERKLPPGTIEPWEGWRAELDADFAKLLMADESKTNLRTTIIDGEGAIKIQRESYDDADFGEILRAANDNGSCSADPRIRLLVDLAAELREEVVARVMRSQLLLPSQYSDAQLSEWYDSTITRSWMIQNAPYGVIRVIGRANKNGGELVLTAMQAEHLQFELSAGYLRELEAAYVRKELQDYPLICGAQLTRSESERPRIPLHSKRSGALQPILPRCMSEQFRALEAKAGVTHIAGRGVRGLRRTAATIADELDAPELIKDRLGFWTNNDRTRTRVYIKWRAKLRQYGQAAELRNQIRAIALAQADARMSAADSALETLEGRATLPTAPDSE